ncbi:NADH-quinone oxidoreductase subunit C [Marininema mesophilum]|uniref:NADH-quinone oxidoreductase subunit C n=1 Tax=Marininema mesophilum TaxID=1048340 RepID=A0A1H2TCM3_9BACL|nr:NADH-quinone oxidoreductase subunit C [Marininema mesophilum]SDW41696.1 NADH-quinone oxidoreductase subunit C [Marininema mesophilum]
MTNEAEKPSEKESKSSVDKEESQATEPSMKKKLDSTASSDVKKKAATAAKEAASSKVKAGAARKRPVAKAVPAEPLEPSPKQPLLDEFVRRLKEGLGEDVVIEAFINRLNSHLPTLIVPVATWLEVAFFLRDEKDFTFDYVQNLSGVDYETHMEVVLHLHSMEKRHNVCVRVKTERESPKVPSVVGVWPAVDWHERETYDLLGIYFSDHPNLSRILMPDDWVGHPLRKDYQPYDQEI